MISARNYAAQCEDHLKHLAKCLNGIPEAAVDFGGAVLLTEIIKSGQHFAIPDGGTLFNDDFKGLIGEEIRLPYDKMTVEYFVKNGGRLTGYAGTESSKRVAIAFELMDQIIVNAMYYIDADKEWYLCPLALRLPKVSVPTLMPKREIYGNSCSCFLGSIFTAFPFILKTSGRHEGDAGLQHDLTSEVSALLELIEALSCRNILHEPLEKIDHAKNIRRIRDGKLPIYETRILIIDTGYSSGEKHNRGIGSSDGPSVRQHLRRGHIRRHPTAGNIWVNSCVVGNSEIGVIDKSYKVH